MRFYDLLIVILKVQRLKKCERKICESETEKLLERIAELENENMKLKPENEKLLEHVAQLENENMKLKEELEIWVDTTRKINEELLFTYNRLNVLNTCIVKKQIYVDSIDYEPIVSDENYSINYRDDTNDDTIDENDEITVCVETININSKEYYIDKKTDTVYNKKTHEEIGSYNEENGYLYGNYDNGDTYTVNVPGLGCLKKIVFKMKHYLMDTHGLLYMINAIESFGLSNPTIDLIGYWSKENGILVRYYDKMNGDGRDRMNTCLVIDDYNVQVVEIIEIGYKPKTFKLERPIIYKYEGYEMSEGIEQCLNVEPIYIKGKKYYVDAQTNNMYDCYDNGVIQIYGKKM